MVPFRYILEILLVSGGLALVSAPRGSHASMGNLGRLPFPGLLQTQAFRGSINVTTTHGFSIVVFDGTVGSPVVPRTSSQKLHFTAEDKQTVERLRRWASEQTALLGAATVRLANVKPRMYFDFTCQLLAKAEMDRNCMLLKVREHSIALGFFFLSWGGEEEGP